MRKSENWIKQKQLTEKLFIRLRPKKQVPIMDYNN